MSNKKGKESSKFAKKNNKYQVINEDQKARSPNKVGICACDRKRCWRGRCGSCWMLLLGFMLGAVIFFLLYVTDVVGFTFTTTGTETLYEVISNTTLSPTANPTSDPTNNPTTSPTYDPTVPPTYNPTVYPTEVPTGDPTSSPATNDPTSSPTADPTFLPTADPTSSPTADPTSERRRSSAANFTANILLVVVDGSILEYNDFETPVVDEFLTEGYTFNNVKQYSLPASLIRGKTTVPRSGFVGTWADQLRLKGYTNYYYGNWMNDLGSKASTPLGWDFIYGMEGQAARADLNISGTDGDIMIENVLSQLQTIKDEKWLITVNWTTPHKNSGVTSNGLKVLEEPCNRYFKSDGALFDYSRGLSCQFTMGFDKTFGKVLETLKSTGLWMNIIVVLAVTNRQVNVFSMNGGALPTNLLKRTNEHPLSMLDVAPTFMNVSGL